ncbi:uncharacterized protein LOC143367586 [Andrena cerasifolii]|uniref:uncharacterized protein LOC143367586 n=1 Tax=Andrena cerasifolii TaxID=2819439 RepID=UPI0040383132
MKFPNMTVARSWITLLILHLFSVQLIAGYEKPWSRYHPESNTVQGPHISRTTPAASLTENPPRGEHHRHRHQEGNPPHVSRTTPPVPWIDVYPPAPPAPPACRSCPIKQCEIEEQRIKINFTHIGLRTVGNVFIENPNVIELRLNDNGITEVSPTAFQSVPRLHHLDLSGNSITTEKLLWFNNLRALQTLIIDGNNCTNTVLNDVLDPVPNLRELSLRRNGINKLAVNLKTFAPVLSRLYVSGNDIESLDFLDDAPALSILHADDNSIESVKEDHLATIVELSVSGNKIEKLCGESCDGNTLALDKASSLLKLNASRNQISEVAEDTFMKTGQLSSLDLSSNKIAKLPKGLFQRLPRLELLFMGRNQLTSVPNVCPLGNMKRLDLAGNQIVAIIKQNFCSELESLETVHLANNLITNVDADAFLNLKSLRTLDLSHNLIIDFPALLIPASRFLQTLLLRNNSIAKLNGLYEMKSESLQELHLQENPLLSFQVAWIQPQSLPRLVIFLKDWASRGGVDAEPESGELDNTSTDSMYG